MRTSTLRACSLSSLVLAAAACGGSGSSAPEEQVSTTAQANTEGDVIALLGASAGLLALDSNPGGWAVLAACLAFDGSMITAMGDLVTGSGDDSQAAAIAALQQQMSKMQTELGSLQQALVSMNIQLRAIVQDLRVDELGTLTGLQGEVTAFQTTLAQNFTSGPLLGQPLTGGVKATFDNNVNLLEQSIIPELEVLIAGGNSDPTIVALRMFVYVQAVQARVQHEAIGYPMSYDFAIGRLAFLQTMRYPFADATANAIDSFRRHFYLLADQIYEPYRSVVGAGDFSHDGIADVVVHDALTNGLGIYTVGRDMRLARDAWALDPVDPRAWRLRAVRDVNLDGSPDLVWQDVANEGPSAHTLLAWTMNGIVPTGTTTLAYDTLGFLFGSGMTLPPVHALGQMWGEPSIQVVWGAADSAGIGGNPLVMAPYWSDATTYGRCYNCGQPDATWHLRTAGDLDRNGVDDLLFYRADGDRHIRAWELLRPPTSSTYREVVANMPDLSWIGADRNGPRALADFNGDGNLDLLYEDDAATLSVWFLNGTTVDHRAIVTSRAAPAEVLFRNTNTNQVGFWRLNQDATVGAYTYPGYVPAGATIAGTGDFTADGESDLLYRAPNGDVILMPLQASMPRDAAHPTMLLRAGVPLAWQTMGIGDFNGDAIADIAWRNTQTGALSVWVMNADGAINDQTPAAPLDLDWVAQGVGDFNGDRRADVLMRRKSNGAVQILMTDRTPPLQNGQGQVTFSFLPPTIPAPAPVDASWVVQAVGDFDLNGRTDIAWRNTVTNVVCLWLLAPNKFTAVFPQGQTPVDPSLQIVAAGDVDNNGTDDLVFRSGANVSAWLLNNGAILRSAPMRGGVESYWALSALGRTAR